MAGAVTAAGAASLRTTDPALVTSPATSNRSFTDIGRPASGRCSLPAARAASIELARPGACSSTEMNTRAPSPCSSFALRKASATNFSLTVRPLAKAERNSLNDHMGRQQSSDQTTRGRRTRTPSTGETDKLLNLQYTHYYLKRGATGQVLVYWYLNRAQSL